MTFAPFDDLTTLNLSVHMLEHILIMNSGGDDRLPSLQAGLVRQGPEEGCQRRRRHRRLCDTRLLAPALRETAVLNPLTHAVEHGCFLLAGFLIGAFFPMLSDPAKSRVLALGFAAHILYGLALIFQYQIYPLYSLFNQLWLGIWVFMPTPLYLYGIVMYGIVADKGSRAT